MKLAYFDTFAGISGDMMVGALLHLGVSLSALRGELGKLPFDNYHLTQTKRIQSGICATQFRVEVNESPTERSFTTIRQMLQQSTLTPQVKTTAIRIFTVLAEAEGRVHGVSPEEVHFHEVGAVDSIIDIVGTALACTPWELNKCMFRPYRWAREWFPLAMGSFPSQGLRR